MGRSRRSRACLVAALIALFLLPGTALAAGKLKPMCTVDDPRLTELSGLASDGTKIYAVNDGGTKLKVFVLDRSCAVRTIITGDIDPYDIEDLAVANDGTLWLGDTGDNSLQRDTVAVHTLRPDGTARLYRLTYPDGRHDAEALLLGPSGVPYIVTKNVLGTAGVYRPTGPLRSPGPTPLTKVAEVTIPASPTNGGPAGAASSALVTGGAVSRDGSVVALRTYTDAYLYSAPDGDIEAALTRQPVRIPLPRERQGEAVALAPDGSLLSGGEGSGQPIRSVSGAVAMAQAVEERAAEARGSEQREGAHDSATASKPTAADTEEHRAADKAGMPPLPGFVVTVAVVAVLYAGVTWYRRRS